ncbi:MULTISPECIES: glycosyltransferase [Stenotrophomonas]|uniref:CgeB family protein n=1 Tax=Stenotrophomonas TaxID=40323 RepID=UPI000A92A8EA|nr:MULTISPECIES: glycosyltransferase [Stenotrophomonas]
MRVLVSGASPDNQNRNAVLRDYVTEGFSLLDGVTRAISSPLEFAAERAEQFQPNLVVCFGSCMPDDAEYARLRRYCTQHGAPMVFWLHDDPYEFDYNYKISAVADIVFSNDRWCAEHYSHPFARHLPLAASHRAHWREITAAKDISIFFCGVAFSNRKRLLGDLRRTLQSHDAVIMGDGWPADLPFCSNQRLPNDQLSDHYARARVTLNMGRDFHYANDRFKLEPSTPGPRTFEAAMAGTTQAFFVESLEIADYYRPGKEILLYNSAAEFAQLMDEVLTDSDRCLDLAAAAQRRTVQDHTYQVRARQILEVVEEWRSFSR